MGQNPSDRAAGKNNTFDRLNTWMHLLGISKYAFVNACSKTGSVKNSDVDLDNLMLAVYKCSKVIALGNFPSEALNRMGVKHFKLLHPSPLNRQINDLIYVANCINNCRDYLSE